MRRRLVRPSAFTLVELMIVIGIVALLAGLLLPALSRVREGARAVACLSNLRQWSSALHIYADTNGGCLPRRGQGWVPAARVDVVQNPYDWFNALPPILGMDPYGKLSAEHRISRPGSRPDVWLCPDAIDTVAPANFFGYAMNMGLSVWAADGPDRITRIGEASTMVFLTDAPGPNCSTWPTAKPRPYNPAARHAGRVNIAFVDGHVASFTAADAGIGVGAADTDNLSWRVPGSTWPGPPDQ